MVIPINKNQNERVPPREQTMNKSREQTMNKPREQTRNKPSRTKREQTGHAFARSPRKRPGC